MEMAVVWDLLASPSRYKPGLGRHALGLGDDVCDWDLDHKFMSLESQGKPYFQGNSCWVLRVKLPKKIGHLEFQVMGFWGKVRKPLRGTKHF